MKRYKFNELFKFQKKSKIKAGEGLKEGGKYPFYTSSDKLSKSINTYLFDSESLIFGTGGQASIHYCENPFAVSTDCLVAQPKNEKKLLAKYAYYYLFSNIHILERGFKGAGLKHISKSYIDEILIPVPDKIETQRQIAYVLDKADVVRQQRRASIELLDKLLG